MNLHKLQLDLLQQHSESFNNWSAIIWINTEAKSLIMKLVPGHLVMYEIGHRSFSDVFVIVIYINSVHVLALKLTVY